VARMHIAAQVAAGVQGRTLDTSSKSMTADRQMIARCVSVSQQQPRRVCCAGCSALIRRGPRTLCVVNEHVQLCGEYCLCALFFKRIDVSRARAVEFMFAEAWAVGLDCPRDVNVGKWT
jgi:hypothetical protein